GTLATSCYASMFKDCTSLGEAPGLPATNLASYCCYAMFAGCTGLTNAPVLPATTLASQCYYKMFSGCTGLTETPALAATTLASHCYANMFEGCTALTRLPELPATTLATACYKAMFNGCTGIALYEDGTAPTWGIPADAQDEGAIAWNQDMLAGTGGTFTGDPVVGVTYYYTLPTVGVPVVYDATGGAFAGGTSIVTQFCAAVYGQLPIANRNGYTLLGWFNGFAPGAAQAVSGGPLITNAPHRLHAHWTAAPGGTAASLFKYTINADGTITITGFKNPDQKAQKVVLPDRIDGRFVTGIAMGAFENSTSGMTEVYFPVFCTNIADKAFISVPSIKRLSFPPNRDWRNPTEPADLHIGKYAFSGATGLTELTLPKTVVALGDFAFLNTRNLQRVTILGHPVLGNQVFRSAGVDVGGVIVHLAPAMAADPDYMATFKQGMYNVTVRTDAVIAGIWMGKMRLAAPGGVAPIILNISVEKAAEWGEVNLSALRVEYRAKLDAASQVLLPSSAVREADGSITLELNVPDGDESGFFRVFAL
ncbi:MAG TPA: leucine-rich repeat domain-containing protein, partial [Acidobacteriota bacterium]|nr:leucine-rich repeat domain-containing protein [Acidobacteriota bacterium]